MNFSKSISAIYRRSGMYYAKELAKFGLRSGMMTYIMCICENPGISQERVAKGVMVDKSTVAKAVSQLIDLGMVERTQNPVDSREYILMPTDRAKGVYDHLRRTEDEWFLKMTADMTDVERTLLCTLLEKIRLDR